MITALFTTKNNIPIGVEVSGHAMFGDYGNDIVCAGVSSSLMLVANAITEILRQPATVEVGDNFISLSLDDSADNNAFLYLSSFLLHLENLSEDYPKNIIIKFSEV